MFKIWPETHKKKICIHGISVEIEPTDSDIVIKSQLHIKLLEREQRRKKGERNGKSTITAKEENRIVKR